MPLEQGAGISGPATTTAAAPSRTILPTPQPLWGLHRPALGIQATHRPARQPRAHDGAQAEPRLEQVPEARPEPQHRAQSPAETMAGAAPVLARYRRQALALDGAAAVLAAIVALIARFGASPSWFSLAAALALPALWLGMVALNRGYENRFLGAGNDEYRRIINAGAQLFVAVAVCAFVTAADVSRGFIGIGLGLCLAVTLLGRRQLRGRLFHLRQRGTGMSRVVVVGRADAVVSLIEKLDAEPQHGLRPAAVCLPQIGVSVDAIHGVPVLGDPDSVLEAVDAVRADAVAVVSHPDMSGHALRRLSWALEERGVELIVSPGIIEVAGPRLSIRPVAGLSLLHLESPSARGGKMFVKAVLDRVTAAAICFVALPVMAAIAAAVRFSGPGPVIFKQERVGLDGRPFTMLKFRSMVADAEDRLADISARHDGNEMLFKLRHDPRVTRVGAVLRKYSLDELPQLFNVIRGEMSLVGPRPPLPREVKRYDQDASRRLKVRPGLTGLWQVSGRSDLSWDESLRLDLRYVDNWSIPLDLAILWRTIRVVFGRGDGAY